MKSRRFLCTLLALLFIPLFSAYSDSPVWKITKGDTQLFIGGTIHVLAKSDYPLPSSFEKAYTQSTMVVFETDLQEMQSPEFQKLTLSKIMYLNGNTLKTVLDESTYDALEAHLKTKGVPVANFMNFKAGMVSVMLTVMELQRLGLMGTGVDEFFQLRAINDQKDLGELETAVEQLEFISTLGEGRENDIIIYTLKDIKELPDKMKQLKEAWRNGDNQRLYEMTITPIKEEFPKLYNELMVNRNNTWMPKIEAMLKTEEVEFVLVGTAHLVGNEGLLAQLAAKGYTVQSLD